MKAIMLTIRLKWFYLTYKGIKTIEVRKSAPKDFVGDVFEVVSKTNFEKDLMEMPENEREFFRQFKGKVGLKFTLNKVEEISCEKFEIETKTLCEKDLLKLSCLALEELRDYGDFIYSNNCASISSLRAWHISNLVIFEKPKELEKFKVKAVREACRWCPNFYEYGYRCTKSCEYLKPLDKAPQSWCYIEVGE